MIIALTGQKGGSGKTTAALCMASEWHSRGRRVLLVDADPQGSTRRWGEVAAETGIAAPTVISMGAGMHRPDQLPTLADLYDVTIIDCPPRLDEVQRAALMVADLVIYPCGPSAVEEWSLPATIEYLERARMIRPSLAASILVNRKVPRTSIGATVRESLSKLGVPILETELCHRVAYQEAIGVGKGVTGFAPTSAAAAEIRSLVGELEAMVGKRPHHVAAA